MNQTMKEHIENQQKLLNKLYNELEGKE